MDILTIIPEQLKLPVTLFSFYENSTVSSVLVNWLISTSGTDPIHVKTGIAEWTFIFVINSVWEHIQTEKKEEGVERIVQLTVLYR